MIRVAAACLAIAACRPPAVVETVATPGVGISIALYRDGDTSYAVVDDRRWVEVAGGALVLDRIDPGAALPSLVIESLGAAPLVVGQCAREHVGAPAIVVPSLRCQVTSPPGRHLVRLLYVSARLGYRAHHDVTMTAGDRATVATRFAIETPVWASAAEVTLFHGLPGGEHSPDAIGRGAIQLDGSTAVLAAAPREVPAALRRVYDGAVRAGRGVETDAAWGRESVHAVWVWLELDDLDLPPGPVHAHVETPGEAIRDVQVPAGGRETIEAALRLPLWIDDTLHGMRSRTVVAADGASLADRFVISVANTGTEPREVWVEERLRTTRRRTLRGGWPNKPVLVDGRARTKLSIKPGATERTGYMVAYVF